MTGKTVEEATERALEQLGVAEGDAEIIVLTEAKTGLFGRVREEARVRARVRPVGARPKRERSRRTSRSAGRQGGGQRTSSGGSASAPSSGGSGGRGSGGGSGVAPEVAVALPTPTPALQAVVRVGPRREAAPVARRDDDAIAARRPSGRTGRLRLRRTVRRPGRRRAHHVRSSRATTK